MPEFDGNNLRVTRSGPPASTAHIGGTNGAWVFGETRNKLWDLLGSERQLQDAMTRVSVSTSGVLKSVSDNLQNVLKSLKTTVIMPAGEAFMFTGVDTDSSGNLYSHVSYANGAEGAERK